MNLCLCLSHQVSTVRSMWPTSSSCLGIKRWWNPPLCEPTGTGTDRQRARVWLSARRQPDREQTIMDMNVFMHPTKTSSSRINLWPQGENMNYKAKKSWSHFSKFRKHLCQDSPWLWRCFRVPQTVPNKNPVVRYKSQTSRAVHVYSHRYDSCKHHKFYLNWKLHSFIPKILWPRSLQTLQLYSCKWSEDLLGIRLLTCGTSCWFLMLMPSVAPVQVITHLINIPSSKHETNNK